MERVLSVEEKIRRAEEIYNRKRENDSRTKTTRVRVENSNDKTYKNLNNKLKKMIIQISVCLAIYLVFYYLTNNNYIFSEDLKNKCQEILSYDISFNEMYGKCSNLIITLQKKYEEFMIKPQNSNESSEENNNNEEKSNESKEENVENEAVKEENIVTRENQETTELENISNTNTESDENVSDADSNIGGTVEETGETEKLSEEEQMKKDAADIKSKTSFVKPLEGTITSVFGWRNPKVSTVSKYHTGIDIAANQGTDIISATNGKVILASSKGAYGNHLKIQTEDSIIIYAHCLDLKVKEGDEVSQGQKIARVGSTGNSTGPHLHFEIRKEDRYVDPKLILDF